MKHTSYLMNVLQKYTHSLLDAYFLPVEIMHDQVYWMDSRSLW